MNAKNLLGMEYLYKTQTIRTNMLVEVKKKQKENLENLQKKYNQMMSSYKKMEEYNRRWKVKEKVFDGKTAQELLK